MQLTFVRLVLEAAIVGIALVVLWLLLDMTMRASWKQNPMYQLLHIGVAGALFHILCEVTDVNHLYCKNRP